MSRPTRRRLPLFSEDQWAGLVMIVSKREVNPWCCETEVIGCMSDLEMAKNKTGD